MRDGSVDGSVLDLEILQQFIAPVAPAAVVAPAAPAPLRRVSQFTSPEGPSATVSVLKVDGGGGWHYAR